MRNTVAMRNTLAWGGLILGVALLACKQEEVAKVEPVAAPTPAAPAPEPKKVYENFAGDYSSTWGTVKCTQNNDNVNCLYPYNNGSIDCKIKEEKKLECSWDENQGSGKARFTKKDDGKLRGTWGNRSSHNNGGHWIFVPKKK